MKNRDKNNNNNSNKTELKDIIQCQRVNTSKSSYSNKCKCRWFIGNQALDIK